MNMNQHHKNKTCNFFLISDCGKTNPLILQPTDCNGHRQYKYREVVKWQTARDNTSAPSATLSTTNPVQTRTEAQKPATTATAMVQPSWACYQPGI
jgi:hypothetical protein